MSYKLPQVPLTRQGVVVTLSFSPVPQNKNSAQQDEEDSQS
jgi:hypothetical protein